MFAQLVMMHFLNIGGDLKKPINEKMTQNIMLIYLLIPMLASIASASGNAGSQSSVTIIRSIALGIIKKSDYLKVI